MKVRSADGLQYESGN